MDIEGQFRDNGYVVLPGFLDGARIARLRGVCDRVLSQWLAGKPRAGRLTNMAGLTDLKYFPRQRDELLELLRFIAADDVQEALEGLDLGDPLFHNTQYFMEAGDTNWTGAWHRDTQFLSQTISVEKQRIAGTPSVHFRVALVDDARLDYVPGSERRWDHHDEDVVRRKSRGVGELSGAINVPLRAGDAVIFSAWGIHRGHYGPAPERRTLDLLYVFDEPLHWAPPPISCFADTSLLDDLPDDARRFFTGFVEAASPFWKAGAEPSLA